MAGGTGASHSRQIGAELSERERQILEFACDGMTDKEIARHLEVRPGTINTYWVRIRGKRGSSSRAELVAEYVRSQSEETIRGKDEKNTALVHEMSIQREVESRLRESEERLRLAIEAAADGFFDWNLKDGSIYQSPGLMKMLGFPAEPRRAGFAEFRERVVPSDLPTFDAGFTAHLGADLPPLEEDVRMMRRDGAQIWVHMRAAVVRDQGNPVRVVGILEDVSKRKAIDEALQASETRYSVLTENISDVIMVLDRDATFQYVSRASKAVFGYEPAEFLGRRPREFIHPDDLPRAFETKSRLQQNEGQQFLSYRFRRKDGRYIWIESSSSVVLDHRTGEVVQLIVVNRDISERIELERQMHENSDRFRAAMECLPVGMVETDASGVITFCNQAFLRLWDCSEEEALGREVFELIKSYPNLDDARRRLHTLLSERPAPGPYFCRVINGRGNILRLRVDWNYKFNQAGEIAGFVCVYSLVENYENCMIQN